MSVFYELINDDDDDDEKKKTLSTCSSVGQAYARMLQLQYN